MALLPATSIDDIVNSTLDEQKWPFLQIAQTYQRYEVLPKWFTRDRILIGSGRGIERTLFDTIGTHADHVGLFEENTADVTDHTVVFSVDWVHAQTKWAYDIREQDMNAGPHQIVDVVETRHQSAMLDMADKLEAAAWSVPASTTTKFPWGVPYYVVYNATTGHNGATPTGHTTVANINPTNNPNYKNYTAQYTDLTRDDAIKKMRTAHRKIDFRSPLNGAELAGPAGERYRIYVDETTISEFEDAATAQNDNLGPDVAAMDGMTVFKRHPVIWIPYLDDNMASGSNPIYMIDNQSFLPAIQNGAFLRRLGPLPAAKQPNVREVFVDLTYQYVCWNRRSNALIAKSDPMA